MRPGERLQLRGPTRTAAVFVRARNGRHFVDVSFTGIRVPRQSGATIVVRSRRGLPVVSITDARGGTIEPAESLRTVRGK